MLQLAQCKLSFVVFQTATPTPRPQTPPVPWLQGKTKKCGQLKTQFGAILRLLINAFAVFFSCFFVFGFDLLIIGITAKNKILRRDEMVLLAQRPK